MKETISSTSLELAFLSFKEQLALDGKVPHNKWDKFYYDKEAGEKAIFFIENYLEHVEGKEHAGKPFKLLPWQKKILLKLFSWKRWSDGTRRYRKFLLHIPKKNGKSSLVSAIIIYCAFADGEPAPHCACIASNLEQAGELYKMISNMINANAKLRARAQIRSRHIWLPRTLGAIRILSKKPGGKHGPNWFLVAADECHAIESEETVDAVTAGIVARNEPLICFMSTAGYDRTHWYYREYQYAKSILKGETPRDDYLVVIFEVDAELLKTDPEIWKDEKQWFRANPNLGVTINLESFRQMFLEASQQPTKANSFKRLHLNVWTESDVQAIPMERWAQCVKSEDLYPISALKGRPCFMGVDLAATTDFASRLLLFPPWEGRNFYDILVHYWFPKGNIKLRKERLGGFDITPWADANHITLTEGEVIDYYSIHEQILQDQRDYDVRQVLIDPHEGTMLSQMLVNDGFEVVRVAPAASVLSDPTKFMLGLILQHKLNHRNNPVLRWNATNLVTFENAKGQLFPTKGRSKDKVDGIYCLILALSGAVVNPEMNSVYDTRGVVVI